MVGTHRTFGESGPLYKILEVVEPGQVRIEVFPSGETLLYPSEQAIDDPLAQ